MLQYSCHLAHAAFTSPTACHTLTYCTVYWGDFSILFTMDQDYSIFIVCFRPQLESELFGMWSKGGNRWLKSASCAYLLHFVIHLQKVEWCRMLMTPFIKSCSEVTVGDWIWISRLVRGENNYLEQSKNVFPLSRIYFIRIVLLEMANGLLCDGV